MTIFKRRQLISTLLSQQGEVTIEELSKRLDVSENTVRNDLAAMEAENALQRVRGGAVSIAHDTTVASNPRYYNHQEEKQHIGRWAAQFIEDGDTILIDASTTIYYMASCLSTRNDLTVLTNGIEVALLLAQNPSNKVILASNIIRSNGRSTIGNIHPSIHKRFFAPKCFISCSGFSVAQGMTEPDVDEASIKSQMLELAQQVYLLVDHSKFGRIDTFSFSSLNAISLLITDDKADEDFLATVQDVASFSIAVIGEDKVRTVDPNLPHEQRVFRIGFTNLTEKMSFARQVRSGLEEAAQYLANVELLVLDNDLDRQTALDNADWLVQSDVDLVIEYQLDVTAGNIIMDKFNQAGIPVIAVDIPMPGATFYGADNYRAGYIAGKNLGHWINKYWKGHCELLLKLGISRVGAAVSARIQGMQEGLEALIGTISPDNIISIDGSILLEEVETAVTPLLQNIPAEVRVAIIAMNDEIAIGALNVFERAERLDSVVAVGQNADAAGQAALRRDDYPFIGTTRYAPEEYGEELLTLALKILNGDPIPPAIYKQHIFINRDNLDDYYEFERR